MQAIADHVYHILIIAFVAATIVEAIVKVAKRPRKRTLNAPRETAEQREQCMREHYEAFGARWSESPDPEPEPLADTDLAVVPIDPREVLWAVGRMIEL
jgi:hypothetical protein